MSPLWSAARGQLWPAEDRLGVGGVPAGVRVTVRRRPLISKPGSTRPVFGAWADAAEHEVAGVGLDRTSSTSLVYEVGDDEQQSAVLWGPTRADIQDGDRVVFPNGTIVEVDGIPNRESNMINGWEPPMSVPVKVTYG